jgi:hypothetical protein
LVDRASAPLELEGTTTRLFLRQIIEVVDGHCQVESYSYRLQADESVESWLIRWEYYREPPRPDYSYPLARSAELTEGHVTRPAERPEPGAWFARPTRSRARAEPLGG